MLQHLLLKFGNTPYKNSLSKKRQYARLTFTFSISTLLFFSPLQVFFCTFSSVSGPFFRKLVQAHFVSYPTQIIASMENGSMTFQTMPRQIIHTILPSLKQFSSLSLFEVWIKFVCVSVPSFIYEIPFVRTFATLMMKRLPTDVAVKNSLRILELTSVIFVI